jgi:hypothetical protein
MVCWFKRSTVGNRLTHFTDHWHALMGFPFPSLFHPLVWHSLPEAKSIFFSFKKRKPSWKKHSEKHCKDIEMFSSGGTKDHRQEQSLSEDYNILPAEMETNHILKSTLTDENRQEKGDTKTYSLETWVRDHLDLGSVSKKVQQCKTSPEHIERNAQVVDQGNDSRPDHSSVQIREMTRDLTTVVSEEKTMDFITDLILEHIKEIGEYRVLLSCSTSACEYLVDRGLDPLKQEKQVRSEVCRGPRAHSHQLEVGTTSGDVWDRSAPMGHSDDGWRTCTWRRRRPPPPSLWLQVRVWIRSRLWLIFCVI